MKEWKASTMRMTTARRLTRAKLGRDTDKGRVMDFNPCRTTAYADQAGFDRPAGHNHWSPRPQMQVRNTKSAILTRHFDASGVEGFAPAMLQHIVSRTGQAWQRKVGNIMARLIFDIDPALSAVRRCRATFLRSCART